MTVLQSPRNTLGKVEEATLLVNVGAKLVCHLVYPHQLTQKTPLQLQCISTLCVEQMVPDERFEIGVPGLLKGFPRQRSKIKDKGKRIILRKKHAGWQCLQLKI